MNAAKISVTNLRNLAAMTLKSVDSAYRDSLISSTTQLKDCLERCLNIAEATYKENDFTEALALRMQAWYHAQRAIQQILSKDLAAPAADAFVEAVCFFLHVWIAKFAPHLSVVAERQLNLTIGRRRPDIAVMDGKDVIAVIECKTNLGRARNEWEEHFNKRVDELANLPSRPKVFLLVLTSKNWPGFGNDTRVGSTFFTLLSEWPSSIPLDSNVSEYLVNSIEPLFNQIAPRPIANTTANLTTERGALFERTASRGCRLPSC